MREQNDGWVNQNLLKLTQNLIRVIGQSKKLLLIFELLMSLSRNFQLLNKQFMQQLMALQSTR